MHSSSFREEDELLPLLYAELRQIAANCLSRHGPGQTLQPTALVHEAWLRLTGGNLAAGSRWVSHRHFLNAAAEAMRHILVDVARRKQAVRNGGGLQRVDLTGIDIALPTDQDRFLQVHEAIDRLAQADPLKAELVKLKFFVGLENPAVAEALGISPRSVERQWTFAKAWLAREAGLAH